MSATSQGAKMLQGFRRPNRFDKGLGALLPEAYKKFWREWKQSQPAAVHYVPKEGEWERDDVTGEVRQVQDIPLPLIDPPESHEGIWGGEAVVKGYQKRHPMRRRVPHFWVPVLRRSVVFSEVLNEYMSMVVTDLTIEKIHECQGFDHYLLKHPACDLRSLLALKLKRKILTELLYGCPSLAENPETQQQVYEEYKCYLQSYTPEEIEWYGHTYAEAIRKLQTQMRAENPVVPHKLEYRAKLIEQLRNAGIREAGTDASDNAKRTLATNKDEDIEALTKLETSSSNQVDNWLAKINPFGKKHET